MSDLKVALVAEGPTDGVVIEAAIRSIISHSFVLTQLQPDTAHSLTGGYGATGGGWSGVYRWCRQMAKIGSNLARVGSNFLENNPALSRYDLIIIHLDGDVAEEKYSAGAISDNPRNDLPCFNWPPQSLDEVTSKLKAVLLGWLEQPDFGDKTISCIPCYCTETWVAAALYGQGFVAQCVSDIELFKDIYAFLLSKPKAERILSRKEGRVKKHGRLYRSRQHEIQQNWNQCNAICSHARLFRDDLQRICTMPNVIK